MQKQRRIVMVETYCGKSCTECSHYLNKDCPGCKDGPGHQRYSACEIAQCCRTKSLDACHNCGRHGSCNKFKAKESATEARLERYKDEKIEKDLLRVQAPYVGHWLKILFWLCIPSVLSSLMTYDAVVELFPILYGPGVVMHAICNVCYGYILMRLASECSEYRIAGICLLIAGAVDFLITSSLPVNNHWSMMLTVLTSFIAFVGDYNEMSAHDFMLINVDFAQSEKWTKLRKWYTIIFMAHMASIMIVLIIPTVGAILAIIASTAMLLITGLKYFCLYRSANIFKNYKP